MVSKFGDKGAYEKVGRPIYWRTQNTEKKKNTKKV